MDSGTSNPREAARKRKSPEAQYFEVGGLGLVLMALLNLFSMFWGSLSIDFGTPMVSQWRLLGQWELPKIALWRSTLRQAAPKKEHDTYIIYTIYIYIPYVYLYTTYIHIFHIDINIDVKTRFCSKSDGGLLQNRLLLKK